eukprot:CAMPEP_0178925624 /NCGR_PEP_ID=MMETSP0786-20121207/18025_1 /TAXON_ID=186022 /ORGANISM="Thalassionema frauenfeldii, Strain CCMP 1798" /LENGTH=157 /DNA_ID=CAMNT_0020600545 /DNA_START=335 /DNA_END=808 /DNA_ORIENTATION=+
MIVRLIPPPSNYSLRTYYKKTNRFINLYMIAISCILVWRGAWLMCDEISDQVSNVITNAATSIEKPSEVSQDCQKKSSHSDYWTSDDHDAVSHHDIDRTLFYSGIASHVFATMGLLFIGRFKSVMAPPANVSMMKDSFLHGKGREFARAARSLAKTR